MSKVSLATRRLILEKTFVEIHRNGFRTTSIAEILDNLGVTKGALYHHFSSKRELGLAVIDEIVEPLLYEMWMRPLETAHDPIACMKDMLDESEKKPEITLLGCPLNNLSVEMAPVDEEFRIKLQRIYNRGIGCIAKALEKGKVTGHVDSKADSEGAAKFIVAAVAGCRSLARNDRSGDTLHVCQENLKRYIDTLKANNV